jgi:hypothetical protein
MAEVMVQNVAYRATVYRTGCPNKIPTLFLEDPKVMMGKCSVCKNVLIRNYAASAYD